MPFRNLTLLYFIKLSKWFMLYMPIGYLYFLENDFSQFEYLTLHAIYSGVIALLEVPTGYIADVWGRKNALVWGCLMGVLGFGVYSLSGNFVYFLLAEILLGIGQSLISGADSALLYDTLQERKQEKKYLKHEGYISALGNVAEVSAALFVSVFIFSTYRQYYYLQTLVALTGLIAAFFLVEPKSHQIKLLGSFKEVIRVVKTTLHSNKILRNLILFSSVIGFSSLSMAWLAQPIMEHIGIEKNHFGYWWAALNTLVAMGSLTAFWLAKRMKIIQSILFTGIPLSLLYFALVLDTKNAVLIPLALFFFFRGTAHPVLKSFINQHTPSEQRATVLSVRSLFIRLMFLMMGPLLGVVSEKISLQMGIVLCGITVTVPAVVFFFLIRKQRSSLS